MSCVLKYNTLQSFYEGHWIQFYMYILHERAPLGAWFSLGGAAELWNLTEKFTWLLSESNIAEVGYTKFHAFRSCGCENNYNETGSDGSYWYYCATLAPCNLLSWLEYLMKYSIAFRYILDQVRCFYIAPFFDDGWFSEDKIIHNVLSGFGHLWPVLRELLNNYLIQES